MKNSMRDVAFFALLTLQVQPGNGQSLHIAAIVPTAPGQIGINTVEYVGTNTEFYSADATTTKWIGVDTVIVQTLTETTNGAMVTVTDSAAVAAITATVASEGVAVGDVNFVITPSGKIQLEALFKSIATACGAPVAVKLKKTRQVGSCVADFIAKDSTITSLFGEKAVTTILDGAGNLAELAWDGITDAGVAQAVDLTLYGAFAYISYSLWDPSGSDGQGVPDVVKIMATHIVTHTVPASTTATDSTSQPGQTAPPPLDIFYNMQAASAPDVATLQALAAYLQNRFASLTAAANGVAATAVPSACQCVQVVAADGTLGALNCPLVNDGDKCDVTTSTQAAEVAAPTPTVLAPVPDPPTPVVCNFAKDIGVRPVPSPFTFKETFNRKAAEKAIPKFCKDHAYSSKDLLNNCAAHENYAYQGETINDGGQQGVLGDITRIFLSMRWDLGPCPNDDWWVRDPADINNFDKTQAGGYLSSDAAYNDCVNGFNSALSMCESDQAESHGSKIVFKCMEFLMFQSSDVKFSFPCNNDVW